MKNIRPKKTHMDGNTDIWNCVGDPWNYRQFPVLIQSNGPIYMTWENCTQKREDCPFHDRNIKLSTRHCNFKAVHFQFMTDPMQKGTIQDIIDQKYGTHEVPCLGHTIYEDQSEAEVEDKPMMGQGYTNHCPYDGMRKSHCVATFYSCPWVMDVGGLFQHYNFHTLNDIP
jgi:hypothetical protein